MYDHLLLKVSKLVEPTIREKRRVDSVANRSMELVTSAMKKFPEINAIVFGGSYAKGTWIRGDVDIDIFAKVRVDVSEEKFERIGRELGLLALKEYKPYLRYSQHPYVEAVIDGIRVNVVPCYDVKQGEWKSAADRSPYHTELINREYDDNKRREVRLLKRFMKTVNVYGAEIATSGFSGYVCEVLILKYGSFINLLKEAAEFKEGQVISLEDVDKSIIRNFKSVLIIPDPVDVRRNLGTAISSEKVGSFILASRCFLSKPSILYFTKSKMKKAKLDENLIVLKFAYKERSEDIIWGQMKSSLNALSKQLTLKGFKVVRSFCNIDGCNGTFAFLLESLTLPKFSIKQGPKIFSRENSERFISANKGAEMLWIGDDCRAMAMLKRDITTAEVFLQTLLKKNIRISGISKGLIPDLKKGFEIYSGKRLRKSDTEFLTTDRLAFC